MCGGVFGCCGVLWVFFPSDIMNDFAPPKGNKVTQRLGGRMKDPGLTLPHGQGLSNKFVCSVLTQRTKPINEKRDLLASMGYQWCVELLSQNPKVNFMSGPSINLLRTWSSMPWMSAWGLYVIIVTWSYNWWNVVNLHPFKTLRVYVFPYYPVTYWRLLLGSGDYWKMLFPHTPLDCPSSNCPTQMSNDALCYSLDIGWGNWWPVFKNQTGRSFEDG